MLDLSQYQALLAAKYIEAPKRGMDQIPDLNPAMFDFQKDVTQLALHHGGFGHFLDTGLGKSLCALEYGRAVHEHTNKPVLMLAPLVVAMQHEREAAKFGVKAKLVRQQSDVVQGVNIANYEILKHFDASKFGGVVLDESSILKSLTGKSAKAMIDFASYSDFTLACSATPAPNDFVELGAHSQFLQVMSQQDMLVRWFFHDSADTKRWYLKGHAIDHFWQWVASWSRAMMKPSDLGYSDANHILPPLHEIRHIVKCQVDACASYDKDGQFAMFHIPENSATSIHAEKRRTAKQRASKVAELIEDAPREQWLIWADQDYEIDAILDLLPDHALHVHGSDKPEEKAEKIMGFADGNAQFLVTKPRIGGTGLNLQGCSHMAFVGLSFSFERYYQAVRRCWRFGQDREVFAHSVLSDTESNLLASIERKSKQKGDMQEAMKRAMSQAHAQTHIKRLYEPTITAALPNWLH